MYLEQFETLPNEMSHQSEASLISFFVGGLKLELRSELKIGRPTTLCKAFSLAKLFEAQHRFNRGYGSSASNREPIIKQLLLSMT